jgi:hypothetical protein
MVVQEEWNGLPSYGVLTAQRWLKATPLTRRRSRRRWQGRRKTSPKDVAEDDPWVGES